MELLLIRHGEALYGEQDGLTELGVRQAALLAERLTAMDLAGIYSSTMARARQTAEAIVRRAPMPITLDERFREIDNGDRNQLSPEERRDRADRYLIRKKVYHLDYSHQNGEGPSHLYERASTVLSEVFSGDIKAGDGTYALVAHGGFINAALAYFLDKPFDGTMRFRLGNTSISRVSLVDDSVLILGINDLAHLSELDGSAT